MTAMLEESTCWKVAGIRSAELFFRAVSLLVPDATHVEQFASAVGGAVSDGAA